MRNHLSLTARLSLMFSLTMLAIWGLVSLVLIQALDQHFARQDEADLRGKMVLVKNLLATQLDNGQPDWTRLESRLHSALAGYGDHRLQITTPQGRLLAGSQLFRPPATDANAGPVIESWEENGIHYRSISAPFALPPRTSVSEMPDTVMIRVVFDTRYHQHFINDIKNGLLWLTGGIALISILLGWMASRAGLKPLRSLARLSTQVTANKLDHRLPVSGAPIELHGPIHAFNNMLDRLEESFQRLTTFSSDIAHELRTPVNGLLLQTQVALSQTRSDHDYREALYANLEAAERLNRMINEMLFLAKSEQGQLAIQCQSLDLAEEVDELIEFFEPLASERQVRLQRLGHARLWGDRAMLQRAISNLLTNAIRYTPAHQEVSIRVNGDDSAVTVEVANPGSPIPPEEWPRLFDRFYRADHARQQVTEGSGLGLAIAKAIVTSHGGTLSVHSDEQETCFTARFPLSGTE
ncbi:heavy metal sensor histidine kinase [Oceanimonas pelagia]|uniref:Sensor protein n=1 Tax=Oceanimonas pelagia TaxID=3028314 RepID=A0AA50KQM6_9GAMM|nr:heavy metal sensor histidine kinase [Oceanimonas pelagia]WMC11481.1 heavy metal sensor histidine kinase [Oceanimonas pelagia]